MRCGRLAVGLAADVLLVDGDPTRDLSALRRPKLVLLQGRRLEPLVAPPPRAAARRRKAVEGR